MLSTPGDYHRIPGDTMMHAEAIMSTPGGVQYTGGIL